MSSYHLNEQDDGLFLLDEQPPSDLQKSASFDDDEHKPSGLKSLQRMLSVSSSFTSNNVQQTPYRSLSVHDLTPSQRTNDHLLPPCQPRRSTSIVRSNVNDMDTFVRQFETRLREHRLLWQKEYDATVQRLTDAKTSELDHMKGRYETKLRTLEDGNRQLEMILEQMSEEHKRVKFELEHQKQQYESEQVSNFVR
jgi:hypothetical protein